MYFTFFKFIRNKKKIGEYIIDYQLIILCFS